MKKEILSIAMLALVGSASAQKSITDSIFNIGEVEVNAQKVMKQIESPVLKLDVPANHLPQSMNEVTGKQLETRGIQNLEEAVRFLPGVRMRTTYGGFQQLSIRGFDNSIVAVDGVRDERSGIDNSYPFGDLSMVESIELIKGPQSVLVGQGAVGGVLNVTRKAPSARQTFNAKLTVGSWDYRQAMVGMGGKLVGPLNYYAGLNYAYGDGWRSSMTKRLSGYVAIGGKVTERDELQIRAQLTNDDYNPETGIAPYMPNDIYGLDGKLYLKKYELQPGLNREANYNNCSDFMKNNQTNASVQWIHTFSRYAKLSDKFAYVDDDINYLNTEQLSYLTSSAPIYNHYYMKGDAPVYICLDSVQRTYPLKFSHLAKSYSNMLELSGEAETGTLKHHYLAGWSAFLLRRVSYTGYNFGAGVENPDLWGTGVFSTTSVWEPSCGGTIHSKFGKASLHNRDMHGIYVQDLVDVNEQLKVLLSGRYDFYRYRSASTVAKNGNREHDDVDDDKFKGVETSAFTYRAGAVYMPTKNLTTYASVGSYFKPINTLYNANTIYINSSGKVFDPSADGGEVFKPQRGEQFEVGLRYDIANNLSVNASAFYINKRNVVMTLKTEVIDGVKKTYSGQVGRMDSRGFDIDATYSPLSGLTFIAGYGYTNAKVRELADNPYLDSDATKGRQYAWIPKTTCYLMGDYVVAKGALKGFGANLSVTYSDDVFIDGANTRVLPDYWMTDLGVSYRLANGVRLAVNVRNLFDVDYFSSTTPNYVPGAPRNVMASVAYGF